MTTRTLVAILLLFSLGVQLAGAQTLEAPSSEPVPYTDDEFPPWALDLRRAEIVATGTLPLTLLVARLLYGIGRFAVKSIQAGAIDMAYAPAFLSSAGAVPLSRDEKLIILGAAGVLSSTIALIDLRLGRLESASE